MVLDAVRAIARADRTVVCTIHQPTADAFESFDSLLLLQRGGRVAYFGPVGADSVNVISYLGAKPGVPPILPGYNPASWMLEVTGAATGTVFSAGNITDFAAEYGSSELRATNDMRGTALAEAARKAAAAPLDVHGSSFTCRATQRKWLIKKFWLVYWRAPEYNFTRIVLITITAVMYGITFLGQGRLGDPSSIATVQAISGAIYCMSSFVGLYNCRTAQPVASAERSVFYRESMRRLYRASVFSLASGIVELPWVLVQSILLSVIAYWMLGLQPVAWKFFYFVLVMFLNLTQFTYFGQLMVYIMPTMQLAEVLSSFLNSVFLVFSGYFAPYPTMPAGWKWLVRVVPLSYTLAGLTGSQLSDSTVPMQTIEGQNTTVGAYTVDLFGPTYATSFVWWVPLILFGYNVAFRLGTALLMTYVNFTKR